MGIFYFLIPLLGILLFLFVKALRREKEDSDNKKRKELVKKSSLLQEFRNKNKSELIQLFHFLTEREKLDKDKYVISLGIDRYEITYISYDDYPGVDTPDSVMIDYKWDMTSLTISEKGNSVEFSGTKGSGYKNSQGMNWHFKFDSRRIKWIKSNITKKDFGIPEFLNNKIRLLENNKIEIKNTLEKDGKIDLFDFNITEKLILTNQKKIIDINRDYIQLFVQLLSYIKDKKENIELLYSHILEISDVGDFNYNIGILKDEIHLYRLLNLSSMEMVISLIEDDMIGFYGIHGTIDKLNIFNSNWEKEVSDKLNSINVNITSLMKTIQDVGEKIIENLGALSKVTEESSMRIEKHLKNLNSSVETNNLLNLIQTYQMYKINKNTKSLRG